MHAIQRMPHHQMLLLLREEKNNQAASSDMVWLKTLVSINSAWLQLNHSHWWSSIRWLLWPTEANLCQAEQSTVPRSFVGAYGDPIRVGIPNILSTQFWTPVSPPYQSKHPKRAPHPCSASMRWSPRWRISSWDLGSCHYQILAKRTSSSQERTNANEEWISIQACQVGMRLKSCVFIWIKRHLTFRVFINTNAIFKILLNEETEAIILDFKTISIFIQLITTKWSITPYMFFILPISFNTLSFLITKWPWCLVIGGIDFIFSISYKAFAKYQHSNFLLKFCLLFTV